MKNIGGGRKGGKKEFFVYLLIYFINLFQKNIHNTRNNVPTHGWTIEYISTV